MNFKLFVNGEELVTNKKTRKKKEKDIADIEECLID